ncbi:type VII secretion-associated serine protease mycosin [Streptomyces sp. NPDC102406]|uniref:type VII secretion-associated serine protease mycosin n=1 Tax=Streptomyces sp. NPDC102406 TaxID=3366171 RepID=UPI00380CAAFD
MPTNSIRRSTLGAATSAAIGLLLVGTAAVGPAYADSFRAQQWHLDAMKADQMWRTSTGKGVTVAVIDTGVKASHPDLSGQVLPGADLSTGLGGDEHTDYDGHGTGIAGMIAGTGAGNGGQGAYGLAPGAKVLPIRLPNAEKANNQASADAQLFAAMAKGIRFAADHDAKVINISQAAPEGTSQLTAAVKYALQKGSLIFAGVGNDGDTTNLVQYPAAPPGVVGVAAIDKNGRRTSESEFGPQVDIAAPGKDIVHACGGKTGYCKSHGTSDATALASASAALIWSKHPEWTNNQLLRVILNTIGGVTDDNDKRSDYIGYGAVRPRIALTNPGDPGPADKFPMPDYPVTARTPSADSAKGDGAEASDQAAAPGGDRAAEETTKADDSNTGLGIGVGVAAVVMIGAGAGFGLAKRRRRGDQQLPPPGAPMQQPYAGRQPDAPYGGQQPYGNQQFTSQQLYGPSVPDSRSDDLYPGP